MKKKYIWYAVNANHNDEVGFFCSDDERLKDGGIVYPNDVFGFPQYAIIAYSEESADIKHFGIDLSAYYGDSLESEYAATLTEEYGWHLKTPVEVRKTNELTELYRCLQYSKAIKIVG